MTIAEIKELARYAAKREAPAEFTVANVDAALADALKGLNKSINDFMRNRYDIYDIIVENADIIVPNKVEERIQMFAEVQSVPQGQKALFRKPIGKARGKQFVTQVGLSGVYETFRLDYETFELGGQAIGTGITMDFERFLDGAENLADLMDVVTEGMEEAVYGEIQKALIASINATGRPTANVVSANSFVPGQMLKLVNTVKAYGSGATIFATPEFIATMGPDAIVPAISGVAQGIYDPSDIKAIHDTGLVKIFRGTPVVEIPQSFTDETNTTTVINPQYAYVLPTGKNKVVKVVFEGNTQINDFKNRDNSIEIYVYKKVGCAIITNYNWGIYQNTGIYNTSKIASVAGTTTTDVWPKMST